MNHREHREHREFSSLLARRFKVRFKVCVQTARATAHDSRSQLLVNPYRVEEFHLQSSADLSRRSVCPFV